MGELLQNILSLREDINNLTELSNRKAYEYCELAIKIADIEEQIKNMDSTKSELEESIMDFKLKKGILFTLPIGTLISTIFFACLIYSCLNKLTLGTILFTIIGTPTFSVSIAFAFSAFLMHSKIFTNYLVKKYPALKEMSNKLNSLIVRNRIVENNLNDIKKQKEEVVNIVANNQDVIESKTEELHKLEQEYFNNFNTPSITNFTNYEVSKAGKKRTRTIGESH